jgi:archaellin
VDSEYSFVLRISISEFLLGFNMKYGGRRKRMALNKKYLAAALAIVAVMMMTTVLALLQTSKTVPSSGTISAFKVGVYADSALTDPLYKINWTNVNPGNSTTQTIYVKNEAGNLNLNLSMTTNTWSATPTNTTDVATVTWNKGGTVLAPGQNATATVTLTVADNAETQFGLSFDVNVKIIGDETP